MSTLEKLGNIVAREVDRLSERSVARGLDEDDLEVLKLLAQVARVTALAGKNEADLPKSEADVQRLIAEVNNE